MNRQTDRYINRYVDRKIGKIDHRLVDRQIDRWIDRLEDCPERPDALKTKSKHSMYPSAVFIQRNLPLRTVSLRLRVL